MWGTAKLQLMSGFLNPSQIFLPQRFAFQGRVRSKPRCSKQPRPGPSARRRAEPRAGIACRQELSQGIPHWIIGIEAWGWRPPQSGARWKQLLVGSALGSLQFNSHNEPARPRGRRCRVPCWAELHGRKGEERFQGQRGLSLCWWRQDLGQQGHRDLGSVLCQVPPEKFWVQFVQSFHTVPPFPTASGFLPHSEILIELWVSVVLFVCRHFFNFLFRSFEFSLFCFKSSSHQKERCGLTKQIFLQLT